MSEDDAAEQLVKAVRDWSENHMDQFETFRIDSKFGSIFVKITMAVPPEEYMHYYKWEG
jgi:hypothetical protein